MLLRSAIRMGASQTGMPLKVQGLPFLLQLAAGMSCTAPLMPYRVALPARALVAVAEDGQLAVSAVVNAVIIGARVADVGGDLQRLDAFEGVAEDRGHVLNRVAGHLGPDDARAGVGLHDAFEVQPVDGPKVSFTSTRPKVLLSMSMPRLPSTR